MEFAAFEVFRFKLRFASVVLGHALVTPPSVEGSVVWWAYRRWLCNAADTKREHRVLKEHRQCHPTWETLGMIGGHRTWRAYQAIKLIRTDTTIDLSREAKMGLHTCVGRPRWV